jgi:hypothetical protein
MGVIKDILRTMDYGPSPESSEHVGAWLEEHESWPPGGRVCAAPQRHDRGLSPRRQG